MKLFHSVAISTFVALCTFTPPAATAESSGPSANGDFEFILDDGVARTVEFSARSQNNGNTHGEMTFTDPVGTSDQTETSGQPFVVKATFDCLTVSGNKAVMSGAISSATNPALVGHRVLLVVEDSGEGVNVTEPDKLTWGVYELADRTWVPSDAEVPGDTGFLLNWIATDAERDDDAGIPSRKDETIGCQTFSLSSYAFTNVNHGQGNIQVRP
jgi:hypothetical protein